MYKKFTSYNASESIMDDFDFHEVQAIMKIKRHTYRGEDTTPSINELESTARMVLESVAQSEKNSTRSSCGGFTAIKMYSQVELIFSLNSITRSYDTE